MANRRLSELERLAFTQIDGETAMQVEVVTGTETPVDELRLSQLQRGAFTMVDGKVAVRSTITGSGGFACQVEGSVSTVSTQFTEDAGRFNSLNFNQPNDGFIWTLERGDAEIVAICDNTLVTPLPIESSVMGDLALVSATLQTNSETPVDITARVTATFDPMTGQIMLEDNFTVVNPSTITTNTFTIRANLTIGGEVVPEIATTLRYNAATAVVNFTTNPLLFDGTYTEGFISRTFANGQPTNLITTFRGNTIDNSITTLDLGTLDRTSDVSLRTITSRAFFNNATSSGIDFIDVTSIINPTFQFPVYLGSVSSLSNVNTNSINMFDKEGTFTSRPASRQFEWPDVGDNARNIKIFAIRQSFHNGMINFKANSSSVIGNLQNPITASPIQVGVIMMDTEAYAVYEAQTGQPGAVSLFAEFL